MPASFVLRRLAPAFVVIALASACSEKIEQKQPALGGSCLACHEGITDVHPYFAMACVDCHGGNDKLEIAPGTVVNVRDQALMKQSHVIPLDPSMWFANGLDDDNDGQVDEVGEFFDGRVVSRDDDNLRDGRLANRGDMDSEMNRDLNYLRFLNPGDLRVAQVSCGSRNKNSNDAMVCHAEVVYDMRRSMMSTNSGVPAGAYYGNAQLLAAGDYGTAFAESAAGQRFDTRNPRIGRSGYTFDFNAIDNAYDPGIVDKSRNLISGGAFDRDSLTKVARNNVDPQDDKYEATAGPLFDDGQTGSDAKFDPGVGVTRTGQQLKFFDAANTDDNRAVEVLQNHASAANRSWPPAGTSVELRVQKILEPFGYTRKSPIENDFDFFLTGAPQPGTPGDPITNPVDAALRVFRAFHPMNWWGPNNNFGFVDFTTSPNEDDRQRPDPSDIELRGNVNNPFGRGGSSGCSSCHIVYRNDGKNLEPKDRTVADNGRAPTTDLPFGMRTDLGQRFYPERHELKRTVEVQTCAACHGFVTRADFAFEGKFENETDFSNLETIGTVGGFQYTTPKGSCVKIFDNIAHFKDGRVLNAAEGVTEDINNNGELDTALVESDRNGDGVLTPDEDVNGNGVLDADPINEDKNGNGCLDLPDHVARPESFDGRQSRIVYGGANGSTRMKDVHFEKGMHCVDCHIQNDVHGDGNMYTRNWDAIQVECEDCHGSNDTPASLVFSGPNGGDDMTGKRYETIFGAPWFERKDDGTVIQHSRVKQGLQWAVPQLASPKDSASSYAHKQPFETYDPNLDGADFARGYAHVAEPGQKGGLECYSCHSAWQPNCLTCHLKMDVAKPKQGVWYDDDDTEDVFFQLFSYTRSPFMLGVAGDVEQNRIATHRSTMQVTASITALVVQITESTMFPTAGGLSGQASNPYAPHTVRTVETKQCSRCHTLKDSEGRIANDHLITEATSQGSGRYANVGDWLVVATGAGMQLLDVKQEKAGFVTFPGFDFSDGNANGQLRRTVNLNLGQALDVAVTRGVCFQNGVGDPYDIAIVAHNGGVSVVDWFGRDNAGYPPTVLGRIDTLGTVRSVDTIDPGASQSARFVLTTDEELAVVDYRPILDLNASRDLIDPPDAGPGAVVTDGGPDALLQGMQIVGTLAHGKTNPTRVRLHGRFVVLAHADGITLYEMAPADSAIEAELGAPAREVATFETRRPALDVTTAGRFAYVATGAGGVEIFDIGPAVYPLYDDETRAPEPIVTKPVATVLANLQTSADSRGVAISGDQLFVADGRNGVRVVDVSVPADPRILDTLQALGNGINLNNASAVVFASEPTRNFLLVSNGNAVHAINVTPAVNYRTLLKAVADDRAQNNSADLFRGLRLSNEFQDPMTPHDPKNAVRQVFTFPTNGAVTAIARGYLLDNIADKSGRRLRDNWQIGATSLSERTVARMRSVVVTEVPGTKDIRGDGQGCIIREGDTAEVAADGRCLPSEAP